MTHPIEAANLAVDNLLKSTLFDGESWQRLAEQLVDGLQLHVCHILLINRQTMGVRFHVSAGARVPTELIDDYLQHHIHGDALMQTVLHSPADRFYTISGLPNREEVIASDHYQQWAKPQGLLDSAGACLLDEGEWKALILLNRHESVGDFNAQEIAQLNAVFPALSTAAQQSFLETDPQSDRLRLMAVVETFRIPVAILTEQGSVCAINQEMDRLISQTSSVSIQQNCLALTDKQREQQLYNQLILTVKKIEGYDVEADDLLAIDDQIHFGFQPLLSSAVAGPQRFQGIMVYALANHLIKPISEQRLSALFGLSQKEAAITALLAQGQSIKTIAEAQFISVNTVKFHLKNIFQKTGCSSQMLIMNLVNSIPFAD